MDRFAVGGESWSAESGPSAGLHFVGDRAYGRNYGQLFLSLPAYYGIKGMAYIADLSIAIAGAWSLLLLAFCSRLGTVLGERTRFVILGSIGALGTFGVNVALAAPIASRWHHFMALQVTTMLAAALIGVLLYRLVFEIHDARTGVFVGSATVLSTAVDFWALFPKRHVYTSLLALLVMYAFYQSRFADSDSTALRYRGLAYVFVGGSLGSSPPRRWSCYLCCCRSTSRRPGRTHRGGWRSSPVSCPLFLF